MTIIVMFLPRLLFVMFLAVSFHCVTQKSQVKLPTDKSIISSIPTGIIQEGWIDMNTFQVYIKEPYSQDLNKHIDKTKVRLAWLLLLDGYRLKKEDLSIAKRLVNSRLFKKVGEQQVFHKLENEKAYVLVVLKADNLKEIWEYARLKIEDKIPILRDRRKQ